MALSTSQKDRTLSQRNQKYLVCMEPLPENSQNSTKPVKVRKTQNRIVVPAPLFQRLKQISNEQKRPMNQILAEALSAYLNEHS